MFLMPFALKKAQRLIILLAILILWTGMAWAVDSQEWISDATYPTAQALWGVKFISASEGWVVGSSGTILHTVDGGLNWEAQESGTDRDLKAVAFVDNQKGWVVGHGGTLLGTKDGGRHWTAVQASSQQLEEKGPIILGNGSSSALLKVFFLNELDGWVGGEDGFVLHTRDGGAHWEQGSRFTIAPITGIHFVDAQRGWMLAGGQVHRTGDGGKEWQSATLPISPFGASGGFDWAGELFFLNKRTGWAVVDRSTVFRTEDGGKTWLGTYLGDATTTLAFSDEKHGCVSGSGIHYTEDGGQTWASRLAVGADGSVIEGRYLNIQGMSFADPKTGWAVGGTGSVGGSNMQVFKTEDGGKSWRMLSRQSYGAYFVDAKVGWNVQGGLAESSWIVRTDDGGDTWKAQKQLSDDSTATFFFVDSTTGWVAGERWGHQPGDGNVLLGYFILHTEDGGRTWVTQFEEPAGKYHDIFDGLKDIYFINPKIGWIAASGGRIFHTTDGGKHWLRQKTPTPDFSLDKIHFVDARHGWAAGMKFNDSATEVIDNPDATGIVLHTDNGGRDWKVQWKKRVDYMWLVGLHFVDAKSGWVASQTTEFGGTCLVLRTTDGGKTWKEKTLTIDPDALAVLDRNRAAVLTEDNHVVLTRDGGKTWTEQLLSPRRYPWHFSEIFAPQTAR